MAMRDQDQLRMIMATPRGERKPLEAPQKKSSMGPPPGKKKSGKKPSQAYIHKMAMQKEREERPEDAYRDRAKERRSDANPDFRPEDQILADQIAERYEQTPAWEAGHGPVVTGPRKSQEEINKEIEESKFLGGDMEHTHLVKGLDFALLNKMRSELDAKAKKEARARKMMEQLEQDKPERAEAPAPRASQGVVRSSEQPQGEQRKGFQSHVARSIHAQLFGKEEELYGKRRQLESFQPGRMGIEFSLDTEFQTELPTIITRSKSDCPRLSKKVLPQMPEAVLERIEKSMHFIRQCALGKDGKRMKRKARPQEAEAAEEEAHEQDPTVPTEPSAQNDSSMPPPAQATSRVRNNKI